MSDILDEPSQSQTKKKLYRGKYAGVTEKLRVAEQQIKYTRITL